MRGPLSLLGICLVSIAPLALGEETAHLTTVMKGSTTIAGEQIAYPTTAKPEIQSSVVEIAPGTASTFMTHPVPTYIYVLEGTLTVEFDDGGRQTFRAGQGFLQAMRRWHKGRNLGQVPLKFLVVFVGEESNQNVIHPQKPESLQDGPTR